MISAIVHMFGGQIHIASALGCGQSTISDWVRNDRVPSWRIPQIIAAAARLDPPVILRPDDFFDLPAPSPAPAAHPQQPGGAP